MNGILSILNLSLFLFIENFALNLFFLIKFIIVIDNPATDY